MKFIFTILRLRILLVFAILVSNTIYAQREKYLLDECYNFHHFSNGNLWESKYMWDMVIADDFVKKGGQSIDDAPELNDIDSFKLTPNSVAPLEIWKVYYNGIEKSNQALAYIPNIAGNEEYRAEAKFIRAYCYFNLARLFGGVPIITEDCSAKLKSIKRATVTEVYAQIEQDLTEAIPILPQKSSLIPTEKYKATQGAAHAVYAQVCLYQQKWSEAAIHLKAIIDSGQYALMANFADLWLMANEHNVESIYEFEYYSDKGYNWATANFTNPESNMLIQLFGPRPEEVTITDNNYINGWGMGQVTKNLVDLFDAQGDVIRKKATILVLDSIGTKGTGGYEYTGYKGNKYTTRTVNTAGPTPELNNGQNIVEIRYADVLLMYAETQARLGNSVEAIINVNRVRARAGLLPLNPGSGAALLDAIFMERTLEFALEGKRFPDIIRWGKGSELLSSLGYDAHDSIWPIPAEIIAQHPLVTQNPGYGTELSTLQSLVPEKNEYAPSASFPWIKITPKKVLTTVMEQYKYNFCMNDSILNVQANYSYNDKNLMSGYIEALVSEATGSLLELYHETYSYDDKDRLMNLVKMAKVDNLWDTLESHFYRYTGANTVIDSMGLYYNRVLNSFHVYNYIWNDQENFYQKATNTWYASANGWYKNSGGIMEKETLTYNSDKQIIDNLYSIYDQITSTWGNNYTETKNTYSNGLLTKQEVFSISEGISTARSQINYEYNTDHKLISEKYYEQNGNVLELKNGENYYYGNNTYKTIKTPMEYLSLVEDLHHIRVRTFYEEQTTTSIGLADVIPDESIIVYPNPSTGLFLVKINASKPTQVEVYNLEGYKVKAQFSNATGEQLLSIDLTGKPSGVYILKVLAKTKIIQVKLLLE